MIKYQIREISFYDGHCLLDLGACKIYLPVEKDNLTRDINSGLIKKLKAGDNILLEGYEGDNPKELDGGCPWLAYLASKEEKDKFKILYLSNQRKCNEKD